MTRFKVSDFYTRHNYNTPAKRAVWKELAAKLGPDWECVGNKYEKYGGDGFYCSGMAEILRGLIDPSDLEDEAWIRYGKEKDWPLDQKKDTVIKRLGSTLANQFKSKFVKIYQLFNEEERLFSQEEFGQLDKTFNINTQLPVKINTISTLTVDKSKCYLIKSEIEKLLQSANEEEKEFISNLD